MPLTTLHLLGNSGNRNLCHDLTLMIDVTCKPDHDSHHARHFNLVPMLHVAAQHQAFLKMPCCISISHQHTIFSVAIALCCLAKLFCCSAGLEDLQGCFDHKEGGRGSEAGAGLLPSFLHCRLLHCPQSCRGHHHTQLPAGQSSIHPSIHPAIHPSIHPSIHLLMHSLIHVCMHAKQALCFVH